MLLKDKVVVISGIGPGLGIKLALLAAEEGAKGVVLAARGAEKLDQAEQAIRERVRAAEVLKVPTDISKPDQCENLISQTVERFGRVDALINSAYTPGDVAETFEEANLPGWRSVFDTNVLGTLQLTQAAVPHMKQQGGGSIVMISSMVTRKPWGNASYASSKGAIAVAAKHLAAELGKYGIRVNTAAMGWMWGTPTESWMKQYSKEQGVPLETLINNVAANIPVRRIPTDDDCAKAALFLASDYSMAVTGALLDVNGGEFMAP
ncbi:SDR family oxidoreductase [Paraburkholderia sacchari]|uniref:SDR family oxidoreductase n=1 Tax=Paraburkholderia sacchari TaxID=159450 RepID=UPI0005442224|nr:SDR family oxidoreductase [Paraburkholderia sacchari]NLP64847.1 SDR family oxidoreductase [Paraburkholderia sacchari]